MAKKTNIDFYEQLEETYSDYLRTAEKDAEHKIKAIPTGSFSLDTSLGIGGIPMRKFTEIYGAESSGKTTLALTISKNALELGYNVLYVDAEQAIDFDRAQAIIGDVALDNKKFVLLQPEIMESALQICEDGIRSKNFGLIVLDSIAAMTPREMKREDKTLNDSFPFILAKKLTVFLQRNAYDINFYDLAFVGVNQVRDDTSNTFYKTYSTPGGHQWKHLLAVRIMLSKMSDIKQSDDTIGILSKFLIKKSKIAPPFRSFTIPMMFETGIDEYRDIIEFAVSLGVIMKASSTYMFNDVNLGKGMNKAIEYLKSNKDTLDIIKDLCYTIINNKSIEIKEELIEEADNG